MSLLLLQNCHAIFSKHYQLQVEHFQIQALQHSVILGPNGSGKSALAALVAGQGDLKSGQRQVTSSIAWISVEQQQALIEAEKQKDCADILDIIPTPSTVQDVLFEDLEQSLLDPHLLSRVIEIFSIGDKLDRPFRALSTGETRKLLLAKAILKEPKLLILDEPWDGLDTTSGEHLNELLLEMSATTTLLFVLNRLSEVPRYCDQVVLMEGGKVQWQAQGKIEEQLAHVQQLQHIQQKDLALPKKDHDSFAPQPIDPTSPLVKLKDVKVQYQDKIVFEHLNWTVQAQQHWQVTGPNGSGKTCLLNLITGDHPQCYVNDIFVFGFQRGNGESIWQIKQYLGYVSNAFHLDYRVNCSLLNVVLSGFYDSIGLYKQATSNQILLAKQWLNVMGLADYATHTFYELSFGDQRLALIARAMAKHPALLILDEPCNGLDDINRLKVLALVDLLARAGSTTLLYVNHHADDHIPSIQNHLSMASNSC